MDREQLSAIAHDWHPIAAPLSERSVNELLDHIRVTERPVQVIDLGCGRAEWLVRMLLRLPAATGVGIDISAFALSHAQRRMADAGVSDRCQLIEGDADTIEHAAGDVMLSVGASHAFGGLDDALTALHTRTSPGGMAVFGEGFWEVPPTAAALSALDMAPEDLPDLAGFIASAETAGFQVRTAHVSTREEWDAYEWAWSGALLEWAAEATGADPDDRRAATTAALDHRRAWLEGYRGVLGFATLLLTR